MSMNKVGLPAIGTNVNVYVDLKGRERITTISTIVGHITTEDPTERLKLGVNGETIMVYLGNQRPQGKIPSYLLGIGTVVDGIVTITNVASLDSWPGRQWRIAFNNYNLPTWRAPKPVLLSEQAA